MWHDLLGLYDGLRPKFVKRYAELGEMAKEAVANYCARVRAGTFPRPNTGSSSAACRVALPRPPRKPDPPGVPVRSLKTRYQRIEHLAFHPAAGCSPAATGR